jgi:hypothetical protein
MALAAGVAVALAVIAVAFASYEGTRSQLQGQVDQSLHSLTGSVLAGAGLSAHGGPAPAPGGPAGPQSGLPNGQSSSSAGQQSSSSGEQNNTGQHSSSSHQSSGSGAQGSGLGLFAPGSANPDARTDHDEGLGLDGRRGPAFGGAAGTVTLVHANGVPYAPPGQKQIPVDSRARALAASGHG